MPHAKPLAGLVVLDMSQGIAGPSCGGHFAEHGAEVIKIEPPEGDWIRNLGSRIADTSAAALIYNRGKSSLVIDLKTKAGVDLALRLAERAHVVIENARPGVMERLGVGFEAVKARQPDIVYVSVSGWGQTGPMRTEPMVDTVGQAVSGLMSVMRGRDGVPVKMDSPLIDAITGLYAFQAATMALWNKQPGSGAKHLDISLLQAAAHIQGPNLIECAYTGKQPTILNPPAANYRTADGWIAVTLVSEAHFAAICRAIGRPDLIKDERYATFAVRRQHTPELRRIIDDALIQQPSAHWLAAFAREGALASRINDYVDWYAHPQVRAVESAPPYPLRNGETVRLPHLPGQPPNQLPVPVIGGQSRDVLARLGLSTAEIDTLIAKGVVSQAAKA
ncbi:MAG: CaiB/BaiF CoA transferase family protein [Hyphomicrobiaceae bacterium]